MIGSQPKREAEMKTSTNLSLQQNARAEDGLDTSDTEYR